MTIKFASHAKGRGFNPLTAQSNQHKSFHTIEDSAFAIIHGHLISIASLSEISVRGGAFLCSELNPLDRAAVSPSDGAFLPDQHTHSDGDTLGGDL